MSPQQMKTYLALASVVSLQLAPCLAHAQGGIKNPPQVAQGPVLTLHDYLEQVRTGNQNITSSQMTFEGATSRADEWKLLTRPSLIASANLSDDHRESGSVLSGDFVESRTLSLGIQQLTDFGLQGKLSYNAARTALPEGGQGLPPQFAFVGPQTDFWTAGPVLELNQSIWRNGFGRETRATQQVLAAQVQAIRFSESFKQTTALADAETAYWRLALARESVKATKVTVERSKRLADWTQSRQKLELTDRSDLLQAQAALMARNLELQTALDEEKTAARAFNTARGTNVDVVDEALPALDPQMIEQLKIPQRAEFRDDVKAAEQQKKLAEANSQLGSEKNQPSFNVVGAIGLNGRDPSNSETLRESITTGHPNVSIGVQLNMPLDLGTLSNNRAGYLREASAADVSYKRKIFEQERLWTDLTTRFQDSVARYQLAANIEKAQTQKLDYERDRHSRGRTTTYQVIQFEQDLANAQISRIRAQAEVLNAFAQLKTFGGGQ